MQMKWLHCKLCSSLIVKSAQQKQGIIFYYLSSVCTTVCNIKFLLVNGYAVFVLLLIALFFFYTFCWGPQVWELELRPFP